MPQTFSLLLLCSLCGCVAVRSHRSSLHNVTPSTQGVNMQLYWVGTECFVYKCYYLFLQSREQCWCGTRSSEEWIVDMLSQKIKQKSSTHTFLCITWTTAECVWWWPGASMGMWVQDAEASALIVHMLPGHWRYLNEASCFQNLISVNGRMWQTFSLQFAHSLLVLLSSY